MDSSLSRWWRDNPWTTRAVLTIAIGVSSYTIMAYFKRSRRYSPQTSSDAAATDPGLLKKHSTYESYTIPSGITYPRIRTFYSTHHHAAELPADLPLLVFIHGLGGSIAQFGHLLTSLVNCGSCLAIDFAGCGLSDFEPDDAAAYGREALAALVATAIERFRLKSSEGEKTLAGGGQKVVLVGHSMGSVIAAELASSSSPVSHLLAERGLVAGCIAICPSILPPPPQETRSLKRLQYLPASLFDLLRMIDRRGGVDSHSVTRFVGQHADMETKKLQLRFNEQSRSRVFLRMLNAIVPPEHDSTPAVQSWPTQKVWSGVSVPLFLVAGEADNVTPAWHVQKIVGWLKGAGERPDADEDGMTVTGEATDADDILETMAVGNKKWTEKASKPTRPPQKGAASATTSQTIHNAALSTVILPAPHATHALLFATNTVHVLSGLIQNFLLHHVDQRLSQGWQLQHLTTSGKWDVKNLAKWQKVETCSAPMGYVKTDKATSSSSSGGYQDRARQTQNLNPVFRAMKTMREVDDSHNPAAFVSQYGWKPNGQRPDGVVAVVDISHETPVYDPQGLRDADVEYHKFPTVSKQPPTRDEVRDFNALIDRLRSPPDDPSKHGSASSSGTTGNQSPESANIAGSTDPSLHHVSPSLAEKVAAGGTIAIHCHYGFNRTGFHIISYVIERCGWGVSEAIAEFAAKRPPGIKHDHFIDELWVRYGDVGIRE